MPTYEYRCVACEHQFERFQRMSDDPVKVCEKCGEPVKRLLFPVAIQFKGNGFYTTDYARRSALSSVSSHGDGGGDSEAPGRTGSGDGSSGDAKTVAPKAAAPAPAAPAPAASAPGD